MLTATEKIVEMFQYIVADVATDYGSAVHYQHGHPLEIVKSLQEMTKAQVKSDLKYPLIALFQDFTEEKGIRYDIESRCKFTLILATITQPEYKAAERYTINFDAILQPLYELLIPSIVRSGYFDQSSTEIPPKHKKTDRLYWGKSGLYGDTGNMFGDAIDAIEINDLELDVMKQPCVPSKIMSKT